MTKHKPLILLSLIVFSFCNCTNNRRVRKMRDYIDLSYWLSEETQIWPGHVRFNMTIHKLSGLGPNSVQTESLIMASHFSTHIDAPVHFHDARWTLDQIPRKNMYGPGVVVNTVEQAARTPNYAITKRDILNFERRHGRIPEGAVVLFHNGWGYYWNNTEKYLGTSSKDIRELENPGLSKEGAEFLVKERNIIGIGMDAISLDAADNTGYEAHNVLSEANKWGIEATANLHLLPPKGFQVYVFPLKLKGASGSSVRVVAFLD